MVDDVLWLVIQGILRPFNSSWANSCTPRGMVSIFLRDFDKVASAK